MKVVLGGIVKNVSSTIPVMEGFFKHMKEIFPQLEILLYENNSNDSTKDSLKLFEKEFPFLSVKSEDLSNEFFLKEGNARTWDNKPCRIEMISYARNQLIEMVEAKNLSNEDFFILMDLDMKLAPDVRVIDFVIKNFPSEIDALFANGIGREGKYYDGYELRTEEHPFGPEILGESFWSKEHMDTILKEYPVEESFIPVISAFGGLAIYRGSSIKGCRYSADATDELHSFYSSLKLPESSRDPKTHSEGVLLGCYLKDSKIFYRNNSGYNYPVCAEHVNFHLQMREKGKGNLYICPFLSFVNEN